ncbi:MAG: AAA family ATPase [Pseudobdellovibrionaceae bacterium]
MMKIGTLIIFSGLPGSGKSTLAALLSTRVHATYIRIDTIEQSLREDCEISKIDGKGYILSYRIAQENLKLGNNVIADSVNPWNLTRKEWNGVAEEVGANFVNIEVVCSNEDEHRKRVENRESSISGLKLPTWKDVLERDYHPWIEDRIRLDTSGKTAEQSLKELVSNLKFKGILN